MITEDYIKNLSNLELRNLLLSNQIKCGPVEDSTRALYEKKLIKFFKDTNIIPQTNRRSVIPGLNQTSSETKMDLNNNPISSPTITSNFSSQTSLTEQQIITLSNDELMQVLKQNRIECGPINQATRSVYIKKLLKHLHKEDDVIVINDDDENIARVPIQTPARVVAQVPAQIKQEHKKVVKIEPEPEIQIIEDDTVSPKIQNVSSPMVDSENKYTNITPPLEFRLLTSERLNRLREADNQPARSIQTTYSSYDVNRSYVSPSLLRPSDYELLNRNKELDNLNTDSLSNRPLLKLSNLFDKRPEYRDNSRNIPIQRNAFRSNIYSELAPPQPVHLETKKSSSIFEPIAKYKYFILLGLLFVLLLLYSLLSTDQINPIDII